MRISNLSIKTKLAFVLVIIIVVIVVTSFVQGWYSYQITEKNNQLSNRVLPIASLSSKISDASRSFFESQLKYNLFSDDSYLKEGQQHIARLKEYVEQMKKLAENTDNSKITDITNSAIKNCEQIIRENDDNAVASGSKLVVLQTNFMNECKQYLTLQENGLQSELAARKLNRKVLSSRTQRIQLINSIIQQSNQIFQNIYRTYSGSDVQQLSLSVDKLNEISTNIAQLENLSGSDTMQIASVRQNFSTYKSALNSNIENAKKVDAQGLASGSKTSQFQQQLDSIAKQSIDLSNQISVEANNNGKSLLLIIIVTAVSFLVLVLLISALIFKKISNSISKGIEFANQLASGNLKAKIEFNFNQNDEIGILANTMKQMGNNLSNLIEEVQLSSKELAEASQQINITTHNLAEGAVSQAAAAEEVSSSMQEMTANIEQNSDNARQTEKIAIEATEGIRQVTGSANIAMDAMKKIAEKINIINDIAFQTNILALNAAVEAARAGEHGRGFAVVAAEVRKLAEKSKVAADEIDTLSSNGVNIVNKAGEQIARVLPEIERTSKLVQEITASSLEQNSGANQVNQSVQLLSNVTQQNATASEQLAAFATKLSEQAQRLQNIVSNFQLRETKIIVQKSTAISQKQDLSAVMPKRETLVSRQPLSTVQPAIKKPFQTTLNKTTSYNIPSKSVVKPATKQEKKAITAPKPVTPISSPIVTKKTEHPFSNAVKPKTNIVSTPNKSNTSLASEQKNVKTDLTKIAKPATFVKQEVTKPQQVTENKKVENKEIKPKPTERKGFTLNLKDDQHLDEGYERF
jgi:methyl-accepting chemotaxis protein